MRSTREEVLAAIAAEARHLDAVGQGPCGDDDVRSLQFFIEELWRKLAKAADHHCSRPYRGVSHEALHSLRELAGLAVVGLEIHGCPERVGGPRI